MASFKKIEGKKKNRYRLEVRKKGFKPVCETFSKLTLAKKRAAEIEAAMEAGTWDEIARESIKSGGDTVEHFIPKYLEEVVKLRDGGARSYEYESGVLNHILNTPIAKVIPPKNNWS